MKLFSRLLLAFVYLISLLLCVNLSDFNQLNQLNRTNSTADSVFKNNQTKSGETIRSGNDKSNKSSAATSKWKSLGSLSVGRPIKLAAPDEPQSLGSFDYFANPQQFLNQFQQSPYYQQVAAAGTGNDPDLQVSVRQTSGADNDKKKAGSLDTKNGRNELKGGNAQQTRTQQLPAQTSGQHANCQAAQPSLPQTQGINQQVINWQTQPLQQQQQQQQLWPKQFDSQQLLPFQQNLAPGKPQQNQEFSLTTQSTLEINQQSASTNEQQSVQQSKLLSTQSNIAEKSCQTNVQPYQQQFVNQQQTQQNQQPNQLQVQHLQQAQNGIENLQTLQQQSHLLSQQPPIQTQSQMQQQTEAASQLRSQSQVQPNFQESQGTFKTPQQDHQTATNIQFQAQHQPLQQLQQQIQAQQFQQPQEQQLLQTLAPHLQSSSEPEQQLVEAVQSLQPQEQKHLQQMLQQLQPAFQEPEYFFDDYAGVPPMPVPAPTLVSKNFNQFNDNGNYLQSTQSSINAHHLISAGVDIKTTTSSPTAASVSSISDNNHCDSDADSVDGQLEKKLATATWQSKSSGFVLVISPGTLVTGLTNHLIVVIGGQQLTKPGSISVKIMVVDFVNSTVYFNSVAQSICNSSITIFKVNIPQLIPNLIIEPNEIEHDLLTRVNISIDGEFQNQKVARKFNFKRMVFLECGPKILLVIQTDRNSYNPGNRVKIRFVLITQTLRAPALNQTLATVWVENSRGVQIEKWEKQQLAGGILHITYKLSNSAPSGTWTVKMNVLNRTKRTTFQVKDSLQSFLVSIKQDVILSTFSTANITVCAQRNDKQLFYGGFAAIVRVNRPKIQSFNPVIAFPNDQRFTGQLNSTGCSVVTFNLTELGCQNLSLYHLNKSIEVTIMDYDSGESASESRQITIEREPLKLQFIDAGNDKLKPGIAYQSMMLVNHADGSPAVYEPIEICLTVKEKSIGVWRANVVYEHNCRVFESDRKGQISFTIPRLGPDTVQVRIEAKAIRFNEGVSLIDKTTSCPIQKPWIRQPIASKVVGVWWSPTGHYLQIEPYFEPIDCTSAPMFRIHYSFGADDLRLTGNQGIEFNYMIRCQNELVTYGSQQSWFTVDSNVTDYTDSSFVFFKSPKNSTTVRLANWVGFDWLIARAGVNQPGIRFSKCTIFVFYISPKGQLIGDTLAFSVKPCFHNKAQTTVWPDKLRPNQQFNIVTKTSPMSFCSISAYDEDSYLRHTGSRFDIAARYKLLSSVTEEITQRFNVPIVDKCSLFVAKNYSCHRKTHQLMRGKRSASDWPLNLKDIDPDAYDMIDALAEFGSVFMADNVELSNKPCHLSNERITKFFQRYLANNGQQMYDFVVAGPTYRVPAGKSRSSVSGEVIESFSRSGDNFNWLFDLVHADSSGDINFNSYAPDSVGTSVVETFCINSNFGLGVGSPVKINVDQLIYIVDNDSPKTVKIGEEIQLNLTVYYHGTYCIPVILSIDDTDQFDIIEDQKHVCVCHMQAVNSLLTIKPNKIGKIKVTVRAKNTTNDICWGHMIKYRCQEPINDSIKININVVNRGFDQDIVASTLLCGNTANPKTGISAPLQVDDQVKSEMPSHIKANVRICSDIFSKVVNNPFVDRLEPLYCDPVQEDILTITRLSLILSYNRNYSNTMVKTKTRIKIINHLKTVYQSHLNRLPKSIELVAWSLLSMVKAFPHIFIDNRIIESSVKKLISLQNEASGCWNNDLTNKSSSTLTAIVIQALVEVRNRLPKISENIGGYVIKSGLNCLRQFENPSAYELAHIALAHATDGQMEVADRYNYKAMTYSKSGTFDSNDQEDEAIRYIHWDDDKVLSLSRSLKISACYLLSVVRTNAGAMRDRNNKMKQLIRVVRWILMQQNSEGGFNVAPLSAALALEAINKVALVLNAYENKNKIQISTKTFDKELELKNQNKFKEYIYMLKKLPNQVRVSSVGTGCYHFQAWVAYNVLAPKNQFEKPPVFELASTATRRAKKLDADCNEIVLTICLKRNLKSISRLVGVWIKMVTGYEVNRCHLKTLIANHSSPVNDFHHDESHNNFYIYLSSAAVSQPNNQQPVCLDLLLNQKSKVSRESFGSLVAFDTQEPQLQSAKVFFRFPSDCGARVDFDGRGNATQLIGEEEMPTVGRKSKKSGKKKMKKKPTKKDREGEQEEVEQTIIE